MAAVPKPRVGMTETAPGSDPRHHPPPSSKHSAGGWRGREGTASGCSTRRARHGSGPRQCAGAHAALHPAVLQERRKKGVERTLNCAAGDPYLQAGQQRVVGAACGSIRNKSALSFDRGLPCNHLGNHDKKTPRTVLRDAHRLIVEPLHVVEGTCVREYVVWRLQRGVFRGPDRVGTPMRKPS